MSRYNRSKRSAFEQPGPPPSIPCRTSNSDASYSARRTSLAPKDRLSWRPPARGVRGSVREVLIGAPPRGFIVSDAGRGGHQSIHTFPEAVGVSMRARDRRNRRPGRDGAVAGRAGEMSGGCESQRRGGARCSIRGSDRYLTRRGAAGNRTRLGYVFRRSDHDVRKRRAGVGLRHRRA